GEGAAIHQAGDISSADVVLEGANLAGGASQGVVAQAEGLALAASGQGSYESPVLTAPMPFTHVGILWRPEPYDEKAISLEVHTSRDQQNWTGWQPLIPDDDVMHAGQVDIPSRLLGTPWKESLHRYVQYRVTMHASADNPTPRLTKLRFAY